MKNTETYLIEHSAQKSLVAYVQISHVLFMQISHTLHDDWDGIGILMMLVSIQTNKMI